jgi:hypothetical protein
MSLNKQFYIYSVDTDAFYYDDEIQMSKEMNITRRKKNELRNKKESTKEISKSINLLKDNFIKTLERNNGNTRHLNEKYLSTSNVVSIFDSTLTRTLGFAQDEISTDIIIVKTYYFQILKDIVLNGFMLNGEKYIYFSSSAGQVRTKKSVYIKESLWVEHQKKLMCGLTFDKINKKGGINQNKFMAYLSLISSATDLWEEFDMSKAIVVDDMQTIVTGMVDFIDEKTYEITENTLLDVTIDTTDGCGMILPSVSSKNKMVRAPWIKGNLAVFDYKLMLTERGHSGDVIDIYGNEYNIFSDDIQVIFTKSQFKLYGFYESWGDYLKNYYENNCEVGYCNEEEDEFKLKEMNYQTLQTLYDMSDCDVSLLTKNANAKIKAIAQTNESKMEIIGATESNINKSPFQEAVFLYPELLRESHTKKMISLTKKSMVKKLRGGKIPVEKAHYTFIVPDLYGFCQKLFFNEYQSGLLKNGEVCCNLFDNGEEIDVVRSPHLAMEHCVRENIVDEEIRKWFTTDAIYISSHDLISKVLQADFDGDRALCIKDDVILRNAKRLSEGVNPLVYDMKKAESKILSNYTMYDGLINAYRSGKIGFYSNSISKIWNKINSDNFTESMRAIKLLCMENNFNIDASKTLYMPTRPDGVDDSIVSMASGKLPSFFIYAKDKDEKNVELPNDGTMSKISKSIKDMRISYEYSGFENFDYSMLLSGKNEMHQSDEKISYHYDKFLKYRSILSKYNSGDMSNQSFIIKIFKDEFKSLPYEFGYIIDSLVLYLFKEKPEKEKSIFWDSFGGVLLYNLKNNLSKLIECSECGVKIRRESNKTKYCKSCAKKIETKNATERKRKQRGSMSRNRK